jgi:preprotein translocase SecE subunit
MTNNLNIFFQEVWQEFCKIAWSSKKEFLINIAGVLVIVIIFSIYFGILDAMIAYVVSKIIYVLL